MDIEEIRKWHKVFKPNNELFEIRILGDRTYSGYFFDIEEAIKHLQPYDNYQIYFSVNEVNSACSSRNQFNCFRQVKGSATSKRDIVHRWWLPIDIDVERPSDVSSTNEEKEYAHRKAGEVYKFLKENGFADPVVCDSSSGYHIYYPIDVDNTDENESIVKSFFGVLANFFTDERVKIDQVVADANRIMRLSGTWGRKGRNSEERPHRMSKILKVPSEIRRMKLQEITGFIDKYKIEDDKSNHNNNYHGNYDGESFDLRKFIQEHNIEVTKELPWANGGTKFILAECPFGGHKAPDSALFQMPNGAISFKCLHNSCSQYGWREFRLHYDPHAYDRQDYEPRQYQRMNYQAPQKKKYEIKQECPELGKKWLSMSDIKKIDLTKIENIKTGIYELDRKIVGLNMSEVTLLSGSNSSGKSSWINTLLLNVVQQGKKVALWSGELRPDILKTWIQMCAAGKNYLKPSQMEEGKYYVPNSIGEKIDNWLDGKFFLYNNDYTSKWEQIFNDMNNLKDLGVKLFILDNLFSLDIDSFDGDKNNKQKELILQIKKYAKDNNVHIMLVAHPRKVTYFLRKTDISGSSDLTNAVDNVFICHRVNNDFLKTGGEFLGESVIQKYAKYGNCIEVAKNRMYGIVDFMAGMYYEVESRRFKNNPEENIVYGWQDAPEQVELKPINQYEYETQMPFAPAFDGEAPF